MVGIDLNKEQYNVFFKKFIPLQSANNYKLGMFIKRMDLTVCNKLSYF